MSELRDSLQRVTDDAAAPIELDELAQRAPVDVSAARLQRRSRRPLAATALAAVVLAVGTAWWASDGPDDMTAGPGETTATEVASPELAREELADFMVLRGAAGQRDDGFTTLGQLASGAHAFPAGEFALVAGRVVGVEGLAGYYPGEGDDEATTTQVGFDDPRAVWRSVVLDVQIDETIVGDLDGSVEVGFVTPPNLDLALVRSAFLSYGTVVLPLVPSQVFEQSPGVWSIVSDGNMFMTVDNDGQLRLPFQTADSARTVLADTPTIEDLRLVPVLGDGGKVVGTISRSDLHPPAEELRAQLERVEGLTPAETMRELSIPVRGADGSVVGLFAREYGFVPADKVEPFFAALESGRDAFAVLVPEG